MLRKLFQASLIVFAMVIGGSVGLQQDQGVSAATTEQIRFMATVARNSAFCFGLNWWHDGGFAADVFADDVAACNDPDGASDGAWAFNFGLTQVWGDYSMPAFVYDGESADTFCEDVFVKVDRWLPDSTTTLLGYEWYKHVVADSAHAYDIWLGDDYWAYSETNLGWTKYPENPGCDSTAYHAHQMVWPPSSPLIVQRNDSLCTNCVYGQFDIDRYIHHWYGWD